MPTRKSKLEPLHAASADLLRALERLVEMMEIPDEEWEHPIDNLALTGRLRLAKTAIAKARGEVK